MRALLAAALSVAAGPLQSQQMVITNDTLPAVKQVVRDILVPQRDSLRLVLAAAAQLDRDNARASDELLQSRGRSLLRACQANLAILDTTRAVIARGEWDQEIENRRRDELLVQFDHLKQALTTCETDWTRLATWEHRAEIRTTGLQAAGALVDVVHEYEHGVASYYKVLDIYVRPAGARSPYDP